MSRVWSGAIALAAVTVLLFNSCSAGAPSAAFTFDEGLVVLWGADLVAQATEVAEHEGLAAGHRLIESTQSTVNTYLTSMRQVATALRADIPASELDHHYDVSASTAAISTAATAEAALISGLPHLAASEFSVLVAGARVRRQISEFLEVASAGPVADIETFMLQYRAVVDGFNQWVEHTELLVGSVSRGDQPARVSAILSLRQPGRDGDWRWLRSVGESCSTEDGDRFAARTALSLLRSLSAHAEPECRALLPDVEAASRACIASSHVSSGFADAAERLIAVCH